MKAEDTVMGQYTIKNTCGLDFGNEVWKTIRPLLKAQAEITWDKAIREVVEWIGENHGELGTLQQPTITVSGIKWQDKLKSWGVN